MLPPPSSVGPCPARAWARRVPEALRATVASIFVLALLPAGCIRHEGPRLHEFGPAHSPHGIHASLTDGTFRLQGELLEVTDRGLLVLEHDRVVEARWEAITSAEFRGFPVRWRPRQPPSDPVRARLTLVSRYPPGLTPEQRARVLEAHGQREPESFPSRSSPEGRPGDAHAGHGSAGDGAGSGPANARAAEFLGRTREALERFQDREEAVVAGYRPLGPDFPGMGDHWVNVYLVLRAGADPTRPPILTYLETPSGPILTGAAFLRILGPGEAPPAFPFPGAWHEHAGTVDEETLALNPAAALHPRPDEPRLAMLHAWTEVENPDGAFAQDNWAVPFVRLGLPVPEGAGPDSGKALFLVSGGDEYYLGLIRLLSPLAWADEKGVRDALARSRARVDALIDGVPPSADSEEVAELVPALGDIWDSLWSEIRSAVAPASWERVAILR